jgi:hypothetical protein
MSDVFTTTQLRETIMATIAQAAASYTAYPVTIETSNRDVVDQVGQTNPYLQVTIANMGGEQTELGPNPLIKRSGQILLAAVVKDGTGTADAEALRDYFMAQLSTAQLGIVQCQAGYPVQGRPLKGLWFEPAIIPFFYFSRDR